MNHMAKYTELNNILTTNNTYKLEKLLMLELKNFNIDFDKSIFYMQNLFLENKNPNLFVFNSEKVIVLSIEGEKEHIIGVKFCNKEKILDFWYGKKCSNNQYQITFRIDEAEYTITPSIDTNLYHVNNYSEIAKDIIDYFIN
ncbi:hypothetical protein [Clostridium botulinum]|uniref:hypothetical protein n=1 Tax=Clostridium botulinum TaxID=1491 RepID=UPI0007748B42|nr:hypothetical protein [Clostridium botulinum]